ncbi:LPS export ABC transporter periplasmic protein LptC [Parapusillimonas sp. SGNA-6]|uniref:LPS export ABC transporter periplasmic protein LptC n=1 Tax=Parapedobacter sp. SGR-10 TaxID=2710879 RepID=UPI0013D7A3E8|nr:LPS export ABC transporter periplasmic protein LptC [Parapedobacter sp. SGR-10]NGF57903.1 LPS export ABC transporter periplasmic protein LptC [Parapedobacter sp. SGR-10]NGM89973.1 LPS export ABC transporter periplasmic protein LptC [Parapusillimonas sp. SGNA-6]
MILARHITHAIPLLIPFLIGVLSLCSCENDMKDIDDIENIQKEEAVDISIDVKIIYSDSAVVKAELTGPELRIYHDSTGNYEFQKGLQIIFFDNDGKETQRIKSDYGVQRSIEGITEFRKNVVINMADGSVIKTEELFYDEKKKEYYNSVPIEMQFTDSRGNMQATSFRSDVDFKNIRGESMTGFMIPSSGQVPSFGR